MERFGILYELICVAVVWGSSISSLIVRSIVGVKS